MFTSKSYASLCGYSIKFYKFYYDSQVDSQNYLSLVKESDIHSFSKRLSITSVSEPEINSEVTKINTVLRSWSFQIE